MVLKIASNACIVGKMRGYVDQTGEYRKDESDVGEAFIPRSPAGLFVDERLITAILLQIGVSVNLELGDRE
jgi:hypothetical protein